MVDSGQLSGVYRSDDAGQSWSRINSESRVCGRGSDFAEIKIDPKDENVVYVANTCMYRSTDGGQNFVAFKGAPGGDDYHTIWINPDNPDIILTASDQGATITVNRGETWSSWYNQPTAQFYHVSTDNQFPYNVYGGQQESGSAGVASRGVDGQITFREWHPVGAEEYGYVAADPLHPNLIYGGKISRYDKNTGDVVSVRPPGAHRYIRTAPVLFSPLDPKTLYFAGEVLFRTRNGGKSWETISPDLTREKATIPESIGIFRTPDMDQMKRRGVIYTVAPSYKDVKTIFCGTDDGLIQVTRDGGKSWKDVTPPEVDSWSKVSLIDAGRFDPNTAYAAINRIRLDDQKPHILRTHDGGQTWKEIVTGLPTGPINTVREDPVRPGLLFCGSEQAVFFSLDDGDNWSPLRLNMPATSIRDLVIHDADVVVGTHGRSFWILDNMSLLRGLTSDVQTTLYKPHTALLVEWNRNTDTPLPPEEPAGKNPPDGAILDYYLADRANIVVLQVLDSKGALVMQISSDDRPEEVNERSLVFPMYWLRPGQILEKSKGSHRFVWDMRTPGGRGVGMGAIVHDTPFGRPPFVAPGKYQVRLMVDGKPYEEPLELLPDPRK